VNRRLLLLCYFYPPLGGGGVHRALGFTRWLPEHGWDCTVVCAGPEDYWVKDETLEGRIPPQTEVIRVPGGSALSGWLRLKRLRGRAGSATSGAGAGSGTAGRRSGLVFGGLRALSDWLLLPDSYAGWARRARDVAAARLARGDVSALLSSSPPDSVHLAALPLARRFGLPWAADFRDPWIGLHFRRPPTAWHATRQRELERRVLTGADLVLAASRTHAEDLEHDAASRPRHVVHLPNGYEPGPVASAPPGTGHVSRDPQHFTMVFSGTLSLMPDVEVLFEALHQLLAQRPEARRRIRVRLAGPFDTDYEDRAVALGLKGIVEFTGPLAHGEARALQRAAELLLLWKPRGYRTMVPGKTYEYVDAGRPILALLEEDDEAARLVRRAGGTCLPPGDREGLAVEIERRYLAWKEGPVAAAPASAARPDWLEEHTRERLSARLAGLLDELAGASGGASRPSARGGEGGTR
jgi:glycosyltransferase involved in cell wall biosynthesis